jgi:hypothetical protein
MSRRRDWTALEDGRLRNLHARQFTFAEIADEIGRTRNSCIARAAKLGLTRPECRSTQGRKGWLRSQTKKAA